MIYPQSIQGMYRRIKDYAGAGLLLVYFLCSWIRWSRGEGQPTQAIYMDLADRRAYLFGIEIWPEELYLLAGILILAALGLFFVTSLLGRIWCGYTCPHTVFVDLFVKVEAFFQGDRNARMRLDASLMTRDKFRKKFYTHCGWLMLSFSFAFGWVCYFYDAPTLVKDLWHMQVGPSASAWLIGLTASTYLFAGWIRQRVCLYICPYGRFQSAMLDNDTYVVTYHNYRGEPRGKPGSNEGLGDCIDCGKCVVVCPMGVDIREGLQLGCIGCGLCIDACDSVMERIGRPLRLIGYDSYNGSVLRSIGQAVKFKLLRAKTILFGVVFLIAVSAIVVALATKAPVKMAVLHERASMYTVLPDGSFRNSYTLKVFNKTASPKRFELVVMGIEGVTIKLQGFQQDYMVLQEIVVGPEHELEVLLFIKVNKDVLKSSKNDVTFALRDVQTGQVYTVNSIFLGA